MTNESQVRDAVFSISLPGPGLGDVTLGDVVEFLQGVAALVSDATEVAGSISPTAPGRRRAAVQQASRVRLVGLKSGSLIADIAAAAPPTQPGELGLEAATLAELGLASVFDTAEGKRTDPQLAQTLIDFAARMRERRPGQPVAFIDRRDATAVVTKIDEQVVQRLRTQTEKPGRPTAPGKLVGRLYEANLESHQARLRTQAGGSVRVTYDPELDREVKRILGERASLVGDVTYDAMQSHASEIRATAIDTGVQMAFEGVDFWVDPRLDELADAVGAQPVTNPDDLHIEASPTEWEELYAAVDHAGGS